MGALAQVVRDLPRPTSPRLLVGTDHFDDAGVYKLDESTAIVTTVDFFPPLVDDPYIFGQIAAANSLSDVYAMGGRPISVLNIVGFPDEDLPVSVLSDILRGGAERVEAAGAVVAGGHTVRDSEVKFGLAVTGVVHPDRILKNGGAQVGDVIVLSKPIGSGILTSAAKAEKITEAELAQAIDVMTDLNEGACKAAVGVGVHSATDVTGFGLIGHASEMAEASGVTIELRASEVPLLENALALARKKMLTRAWGTNLEYLGDRFTVHNVDEMLVKVLADAQTSGGLLLSVAEDRADRLVAALKEQKTRAAAIVGYVVAKTDQAIVLR